MTYVPTNQPTEMRVHREVTQPLICVMSVKEGPHEKGESLSLFLPSLLRLILLIIKGVCVDEPTRIVSGLYSSMIPLESVSTWALAK